MEGSKAFLTMRTADTASSPKIWRSAPRMEPRSPSPIHTCRRMIGPTTIRAVIDATFEWMAMPDTDQSLSFAREANWSQSN